MAPTSRELVLPSLKAARPVLAGRAMVTVLPVVPSRAPADEVVKLTA